MRLSCEFFIAFHFHSHSHAFHFDVDFHLHFHCILHCIGLHCIGLHFPLSILGRWSVITFDRLTARKLTTKQSRTDDPPSPSPFPFPFPFPFHWFSLRVFYSKHDLQLISNKLHWTKKNCNSSLNKYYIFLINACESNFN